MANPDMALFEDRVQSDLNQSTLTGMVVRPGVIIPTDRGESCCNVRIGTLKIKPRDRKVTWLTITGFNDRARDLAELQRGDRVLVTGEMRQRVFRRDDNTEGTNLELIVDKLMVLHES